MRGNSTTEQIKHILDRAVCIFYQHWSSNTTFPFILLLHFGLSWPWSKKMWSIILNKV